MAGHAVTAFADRLSAASPKLDKRARNIRILTLDIERAPAIGYAWDMWQQNITPDKLISPPRTMCFAAKWLGDRNVTVIDERDGHQAMIEKAWELISEADVLITYNGEKADIPWLNEHFADYGLGPAAPYKSVDLIKTNRRQFKLPYRRLDYLAGRYMGEAKHHTEFQLWIDCMAGDPKAWDRMRKYNANDVVLTEKLYLRMLPWLVDQPHIGVLSGVRSEWTCPRCGSDKITKQEKVTNAFVRQYSLWRCSNCLGWLRDQFLRGEPVRTRSVR